MSINRQQRRQMQRRGEGNGEPAPDDGLITVGGVSMDGALAMDASAAAEAEERATESVATARAALAPSRHRTGPRQFLHEVNVELRKVVWPSWPETLNYSTVVLFTLSIVMALIFVLDLAFEHGAGWLFNP